MAPRLLRTNEQGIRRQEIVVVVAVLLGLLGVLSPALLLGRLIFSHDTIWHFGMAHYFYNMLMKGYVPYWDVYHYCGQPFYYNMGIGHLFDINTVLLILCNRIMGCSLLGIYHWDVAIKMMLAAIGVYAAVRQTNRFIVSNYVVLIAFVFSSFTLMALRQGGNLTAFSWTPWAVWFFLRLRREFTVANMAGCALFLGMTFTSYQAGYVCTFLQIFFVSLFFNDRAWLASLFKEQNRRRVCAVGIAIVLLLSLQAIAVFIEKDRSVPVVRQLITGKADQSFVPRAGVSPSMPGDYLGLVVPAIPAERWKQKGFSESTLYIGIIPLLLALAGILYSRQRLSLNFRLTGLLLVALSLELKFRLGIIGAMLFPFLYYARHMELFQPFVIFVLIYFVGQGTDILLEKVSRMKELHHAQ